MALRDLVPRRRGRSVAVSRREADPFLALQTEANRLFEDFWRGFGPAGEELFGGTRGFEPRVDVEEIESEIRVEAELPGLEEKDFEVMLESDRLILKGERRLERGDESEGWYERAAGSFQRVIPLPCEVEAEEASARYRNGVLRVTLPKTEQARRRARRITVEAA